MNQANRVNNNAKWIREQMSALRDGVIVCVWHEKSARIRDIDNEIKLVGMQVNREVGMHYVVYRKKRE